VAELLDEGLAPKESHTSESVLPHTGSFDEFHTISELIGIILAGDSFVPAFRSTLCGVFRNQGLEGSVLVVVADALFLEVPVFAPIVGAACASLLLAFKPISLLTIHGFAHRELQLALTLREPFVAQPVAVHFLAVLSVADALADPLVSFQTVLDVLLAVLAATGYARPRVDAILWRCEGMEKLTLADFALVVWGPYHLVVPTDTASCRSFTSLLDGMAGITGFALLIWSIGIASGTRFQGSLACLEIRTATAGQLLGSVADVALLAPFTLGSRTQRPRHTLV